MKEAMTIDGSIGEGGGQIFRTSLTLSMCLGLPVHIINIRAKRSKPGLLRQHLACLNAAKEICDAKVQGGDLGSQDIVFVPGKVKPGCYHFVVGSAGSSTLIFQTIVMPLLLTGSKSEITLEGGTHNPMAPTFHFIEQSFLPVLTMMGCSAEAALESYGFYPAGGGKWRVQINPALTLKPLVLVHRARVLGIHVRAVSSRVPAHVTERELRQIAKRCRWSADQLKQEFVESVGPGNVVTLTASMVGHCVLFEGFGVKNIPAEKVADKVVDAYRAFDQANVPVCEHLADQLIVPMVLGKGGKFRTTKPSLHLLTNIEVVKKVAKADVIVKELEDQTWEVSVG